MTSKATSGFGRAGQNFSIAHTKCCACHAEKAPKGLAPARQNDFLIPRGADSIARAAKKWPYNSKNKARTPVNLEEGKSLRPFGASLRSRNAHWTSHKGTCVSRRERRTRTLSEPALYTYCKHPSVWTSCLRNYRGPKQGRLLCFASVFWGLLILISRKHSFSAFQCVFRHPLAQAASYSHFQAAGLPMVGAFSRVTWALRAETHGAGQGLTALEPTQAGACNHLQEASLLLVQVTWASRIGTHAGRNELPALDPMQARARSHFQASFPMVRSFSGAACCSFQEASFPMAATLSGVVRISRVALDASGIETKSLDTSWAPQVYHRSLLH